MKLNALIKRLQKLQSQIKGDPDVIIDFDENGYFSLEEAGIVEDEGEVMINIKSSNEA